MSRDGQAARPEHARPRFYAVLEVTGQPKPWILPVVNLSPASAQVELQGRDARLLPTRHALQVTLGYCDRPDHHVTLQAVIARRDGDRAFLRWLDEESILRIGGLLDEP
jgi:hypothetical protein